MTHELDTDIEAAFIGCLLLDYHATLSETADFGVSPEMFASRPARQAFEAIRLLARDRCPVDPLSVRQTLADGGGDADGWAGPYLSHAIDLTPSAAHAAYYGQLLRLKHESRLLRKILGDAYRRLETEPADMVQNDLMRLLARHDADPAAAGLTFAEAADQAVDAFRKAADGTSRVRSGFAFLDSAGGIQDGELIVISGKAGSCKTTLARQILTHVCGVEKVPAALVTLEMSEAQIAGQTLTDQSGTSYRKFMAGVANEADWSRLFAAKASSEGWPLHITHRARTPSRLAAFAHKVVRRGARLIVLDYLQALQPDPAQARLNIEQQVSFASNTVRDLAVSLGVRFIVVCTESREGELRYSDAIRYDAWRWIQMRQPDENTENNPVYLCTLKKNRFGVLPRKDRELYRVGDRLLTEEEWKAQSKQ